MYAGAYQKDDAIDLSYEDFESLYAFAKNLKRGITWDKIFVLPPKNKFVDDGTRYMKQSSMDERMQNYHRLMGLIVSFGWDDKVEVLDGSYHENFLRVKEYIESKENILSPSSIRGYYIILNNCLGYIGNIKIKDFTEKDLQRLSAYVSFD